MIISDLSRLLLYNLMGICPIWSDWAAKSMDTTFRGLFMPVLASISTITAITLAKTSSKRGTPEDPAPVQVVNKPNDAVPVTETK